MTMVSAIRGQFWGQRSSQANLTKKAYRNTRYPYGTKTNEVNSLQFVVALQRRPGLVIAHAAPKVTALRAAKRMEVDYYGDTMANGEKVQPPPQRRQLCKYVVFD
jgi:hypothetical protein